MTAALTKLREGTLRKSIKQTHLMAYKHVYLLAAAISAAQPIIFDILFFLIVLLIVHSFKIHCCIAKPCILSITTWYIYILWGSNSGCI